MPARRHPISASLSMMVLLAGVAAADDPKAVKPGSIDFSRDIRPILAKSCVGCHGSSPQKGGLRLDQKDRALAGGDTGPVIVAGKADQSLLYQYVAGLEPDHVMPPPRSKVPRPSDDEIARLRDWIEQGAKWPDGETVAIAVNTEVHWSFRPPVRPGLPSVRDGGWCRNPIDRFVLARLEKEGWKPSAEADKVTLIRRLSLDLTGLPPTIAEVDAFVKDRRPDAYEQLVDRLLASPHYGERWARVWLDKARYADTNGYEKDRERSIWPYRDWVIKALNDDMPFDQFTVKQLAGDMLPNATADDLIATGFHRNTMRNEEGGIDVEEFRYASIVDRVATTGATWLGLTIQCAQCHTHKYDPITHKEYYQFFAYFNNADEPEEYPVPDASMAKKRAEIFAEARRLEEKLADRFPAEDPEAGWLTLTPVQARTSTDAKIAFGKDGVVTVDGPSPDKDTYILTLPAPSDLSAIRLDALADSSSPAFGPGRTPHGNFVLSGATAALVDGDTNVPVTIASATADFTQASFHPSGVLDEDPSTGWAIDDGSGRCDKSRSAVFHFKDWPKVNATSSLVLTLRQDYGGQHTLGRFRLRAKGAATDKEGRPTEERRREHLQSKLSTWERSLAPHRWTVLPPSKAVSRKLATMTVEPDGSVLASGDKPNNDVYDIEVVAAIPRITAIRLEALTHESLPENGPGRAPLFSLGDFILTEFVVDAIDPAAPKVRRRVKLSSATQDYAEPGHTAAMAIDGVPESGWTIKGGTGKPHAAVFELAEPLEFGEKPIQLAITLHQFGIHNTTIGRFRISVTGDQRPVKDSGVPADVEAAALLMLSARSRDQSLLLERHFVGIAPELSAERSKIDAMRRSAPRFETSLVLQEREAKHSRTTRIHRRGEFLDLADPVTPGLPSFLPTPRTPVADRLALARWIASNENPLTGRVAANSMWQAFFGRGLVATTEDFGTRGERPSHPELLDWLALEYSGRGWSTKAMHRLIVTSATYRQDSKATPESAARDPKNILLARGSRFRVEAEAVRDIALTASGLLNPKVGGPSVYPPQPDGVTALAYGQAAWPTSSGADRYRRGLYTFTKRAAPFAAFSLMDAPSPEVACVRRERSNTPLQALTLLNDATFVEAARSLAAKALVESSPSDADRAVTIFRSCVARRPGPDELNALLIFFLSERDHFRSGGADPASLVPNNMKGADRAEMAAWTLVARAVLNLDETITRE